MASGLLNGCDQPTAISRRFMAWQVEAAQSRRLLSLEETVMLRDRKIAELQAQVPLVVLICSDGSEGCKLESIGSIF